MLGAGKRAQGKQVEKGDDVHSRETKIILGGVEVEDNAMVRLGPVDRAKQFHSLSEIALDVKSFPAPDGGCRGIHVAGGDALFVCFFLRPQIRDLT